MSSPFTGTSTTAPPPARKKRDRTHWLYVAVIVAVVAGVVLGLVAPAAAKSVGVLGTMFVSLIKMMITPVIFCTIVLGIGSVRKAATVGRVGGLAFVYFLVMSTVALAIGLVVGNLIHPGSGLNLSASTADSAAKLADTAEKAGGLSEFFQGIIPTTLLSALTSGNVLQTLFVALLVGFAVQMLGPAGEPILRGVASLQRLVFKILTMILWLAPIGAFGAIASVVGQTGWAAVTQLLTLMVAFYLTCLIFVFGILGGLLKAVANISIFRLVRYLAREYLLIFATSSSESALPRLIAKMDHLGVGPQHGRRRRPDRVLVQPRRHGDLPDHGVAVHRRGYGRPAHDPRADLVAAVHDHREQGCGRRQRRGPGDPRRWTAEPPPGAARRRRPHRRHRPVHVRGARRHELLRQRRRHGPRRLLDQDRRQGADGGGPQRTRTLQRGGHAR